MGYEFLMVAAFCHIHIYHLKSVSFYFFTEAGKVHAALGNFLDRIHLQPHLSAAVFYFLQGISSGTAKDHRYDESAVPALRYIFLHACEDPDLLVPIFPVHAAAGSNLHDI